MESLIVSSKQLPSIKEGIIKGLEIASGAKSSATYYHKKEDQVAAVKKSIENLYEISKELPLILANQKGVTGFFIQEVLLNEFKKTSNKGSCNIINPKDWYDAGLSNTAIIKALHELDTNSGITYALRLFSKFKNDKVNNARARKITLSFILNHPNLEFVSVKYRNKLKDILVHFFGVKMSSTLVTISKNYVETGGIFKTEKSADIANGILKHSTYPAEVILRYFLFIMGEAKESYFKHSAEYPIISQYFLAKRDIYAAPMIPEEIILGIIGDKRHPQYVELWSSKDKKEATKKKIRENVKVTSENQKMRQTKSSQKMGADVVVNTEKVTDFLALYKTGYETGFTEEIKSAINILADKKKVKNFPYDNVGMILDKSLSMRGNSSESKNTPIAISDFSSLVIEKSCKSSNKIETDGLASDIATSFLNLIEKSDTYDAIFIFSDGYENSYDGLLNEVIDAWREITGKSIPIYHISPITGAEVNAKVRSFGNQISTLAINKPESLILQINSKLLEQDIKKWLEREIKSLERK